ncbi:MULTISPECIES: molybdopterin molybdotransferase MoeA [unclassified Streptomyces]|uniref:Molybdopterin molybdenumtransferase n=1 Tax=Streptomyces sp. NBC_00119 TaxID=2975659 RepID=A0AAU1UAZ5_9ACTN|nr:MULTISPECIES: molybdopterin molybdotransferase MoeA [unclassified Streptomyces]MCX4644314.1 molybdopterin molybdotransferase MoeA [Streptomyces sp. NBC_01446]MCX5325426.1 molybdopterin molybdotransferase MoeA [Streptomyces sp. NBC_00120]
MSGQSAESLAAQARAAEDGAVDEALALVNEARAADGRGAGGAGVPGAAGSGDGRSGGAGSGTGRPGPERGSAERSRRTEPATSTCHTDHPDQPDPTRHSAPSDQRTGSRHQAVSWSAARAVAGRAGRAAAARRGTAAERRVPLDRALGLTLAEPLAALSDLPSFDTSAMDGWVVAGPGPWDVRAEGILAGQDRPEPLSDGEAVQIATGARVPRDATAVIRSEHGRTDDKGRLFALGDVGHGQDIRPRGQECRSGDQLLPAGALVTPAVLGLAAAAGYDELLTVARPRVEVFILGDELLTEGLPREGLIRDALGPMLPAWLRALGAEVTSVRRLGDDPKALLKAVRASDADLIVTTGGTASGPVDHVHPTLSRVDAELLVDGVAVRPGHPMLLARTKEGQHLVGLPGNPLAAVSGLLTLAEPLLRMLAGRPEQEPYTVPLQGAVHGHPHDTRLVPVVVRGEDAVPLRYNGPAMLRGIAAADGLAVVAPGGAKAGREVEILDLPWSWNPAGDDGGDAPTERRFT